MSVVERVVSGVVLPGDIDNHEICRIRVAWSVMKKSSFKTAFYHGKMREVDVQELERIRLSNPSNDTSTNSPIQRMRSIFIGQS
jgi:hypothetical protein